MTFGSLRTQPRRKSSSSAFAARSRTELSSAGEIREREVVLLVSHRVCVDAKRQRGIRVAELVSDLAHRLARPQRQRRPRMPRTVELEGTQPRRPGTTANTIPRAADVPLVERCAGLRAEDML